MEGFRLWVAFQCEAIDFNLPGPAFALTRISDQASSREAVKRRSRGLVIHLAELCDCSGRGVRAAVLISIVRQREQD